MKVISLALLCSAAMLYSLLNELHWIILVYIFLAILLYLLELFVIKHVITKIKSIIIKSKSYQIKTTDGGYNSKYYYEKNGMIYRKSDNRPIKCL